MPNPSEDNSHPDIMLATKDELVAMSLSKDKLLGCAARDELKRREIPGEPASPELCKALGINADDVAGALPPRATPGKVIYDRGPESFPPGRHTSGFGYTRKPSVVIPPRADPREEEMLRRATESLAGESVKTKEAVVTTVATYLANKADNWWMQPASFREKEMFFVIKMLVHTYSSLEEL